MNPFLSGWNRGASLWAALSLGLLLPGCGGNSSNGGLGTIDLPPGRPTPTPNATPTFSGPSLFFVHGAEGAPARIESVAVDGTNRQVVSTLGSGTPRATLNADRTKVVYVQANGLVIQDIDGKHRHRLTRNPLGTFDAEPDFRPDGKAVLFARFASERSKRHLHLATVDIASGQVTSIGDGNIPGRNAEYSPDGSQIIFETPYAGSYDNPNYVGEELYRIQASGSNPLRLTMTPSREFEPTFSPDGKRIAFISALFGPRDIFTASPDGSAVRRVLKGSLQDGLDIREGLTFVNEQRIAFLNSANIEQIETVNANVTDGAATPIVTVPDFSLDGLVN